jgi:hypothetical protein
MCTGLEVAIAGAVVSAVGVVQQGVAARQQGKTQARVLSQQAESERRAAASREEDFRKRQSRVMAARRASLGAAGIDQATGSPLLASEDFAGEVELQALRIRQGGEVRATRLEQQGHLQRLAGRQAQTGGFFRAGSLLVSGAGKVF